MNKVFFVVFLGIIVSAMALIFFNQATVPPSVPSKTETAAQATVPAKPEPVRPEPAKPEPVKPAPPTPDPAKPDLAQPEPVKPAPPAPDPAKPDLAQPEPAKPEPAKPASVKPEPAKPEAVKHEPAKPAAPAPVEKSLALKNIGLHTRDKGLVLRIEADGGFSYKTFVLPGPDRFVVDLGGAWSGMRVPGIPSNSLVKSVRVGSQAGGPRLVLDLQRAPKKNQAAWAAPTVLEIYLE